MLNWAFVAKHGPSGAPSPIPQPPPPPNRITFFGSSFVKKRGTPAFFLGPKIRKQRTWAIAVRRGLCKSLFLLNSGRFFPKKNREIQIWTLIRLKQSKSLWPKFFPLLQKAVYRRGLHFLRPCWQSKFVCAFLAHWPCLCEIESPVLVMMFSGDRQVNAHPARQYLFFFPPRQGIRYHLLACCNVSGCSKWFKKHKALLAYCFPISHTSMLYKHSSGMARVRLADLNGPKWTSLGQNGPKWTILVHFGLSNAKFQFGIRSKWSKMVVSTILDHFGPVLFPTVPRPRPNSVLTSLGGVSRSSFFFRDGPHFFKGSAP